VHCHACERGPGADPFPARGATVFGRIAITTLAGEPRADRSGVVVFVDDVPGYVPAPSGRVLAVRQQSRTFVPSVLAIEQGASVEFPNDDAVLHNVFSRSKARVFDLGVYGKGASQHVRFDDPGLIRVYCNIHPEMECSIVVLRNRYFAVSEPDGSWSITGLPEVELSLRTWHRHGGDREVRVHTRASATLRVDFDVREDRRTVPHANKFDRPYRRKY